MAVMVEQRPLKPFKSSDEYLWAMKEDLAEWMNKLYPNLYMSAEVFMERLETGVVLCKHTDRVREYAQKYVARKEIQRKTGSEKVTNILSHPPLKCNLSAKRETFFSRDNVSNFITWCRKALKIIDCLLFETDDLIMRKNEKHVIFCLLEVARYGSRIGMPVPTLVMLEREIDKEIANDNDEVVLSEDESEYEIGSMHGNDIAENIEIITKDIGGANYEFEPEDIGAPNNVSVPEDIDAANSESVPEDIGAANNESVPEDIGTANDESVPEDISAENNESVAEDISAANNESVPEDISAANNESVPEGGSTTDNDSIKEDRGEKTHSVPEIVLHQQIVTNDLKNVDDIVRVLLEGCTCPKQYPMTRISEGKYRIGDSKVLIFVRLLRNHVMVRVGGGWDTLEHYLEKHDPCRHRQTTGSTLSRVRPGTPNRLTDICKARVTYERKT
ncbi:hypothetical protein GE061_003766 [Apolygus lucorum]|uniref:GAR domain-containing protein n=1 Tax=Apolygus lucorum TaxID=248454 RepID=A0A8S9X4Q3_APOLU|nr:hypothetical protein GE061_003766 [Apolygus lucorum]